MTYDGFLAGLKLKKNTLKIVELFSETEKKALISLELRLRSNQTSGGSGLKVDGNRWTIYRWHKNSLFMYWDCRSRALSWLSIELCWTMGAETPFMAMSHCFCFTFVLQSLPVWHCFEFSGRHPSPPGAVCTRSRLLSDCCLVKWHFISRTVANFGDRAFLQCSWTSSLELSVYRPQTAGLGIQPFQTVADDSFI